MNANHAAVVIKDLVDQAESLGYDYAAHVGFIVGGHCSLSIRDLDTGETSLFRILISEVS